MNDSRTDFPGSLMRCISLRLGHFRSLPERLDTLHHRYGDVFWYYPSFLDSRVLVIYDSDAIRGILDEESWIFNKALEPWHDRHQSYDAFERMVGDGLLLSDGNHHRKHAALFVKALADQVLWSDFESRVRSCIQAYQQASPRDSLQSICSELARVFLNVYYKLNLDDTLWQKILQTVPEAWLTKDKQLECPFRHHKRKSPKSLINEIDSIKSQIRALLDQRSFNTSDCVGPSALQISNQALVDEVVVMIMSFVCKLPPLLQASIQCIEQLDDSERLSLSLEWSVSLPSPSTEILTQFCPHTCSHLPHLLRVVQPPQLLLKRVTVCDALIHGRVVPETTELWIPTWPSQLQLLFGLGCYGCKGEYLSLTVAARLMQWYCRLS